MSHLILVLGAHRSGTSIVAKATECLGSSLGDYADWSGPDNPITFAEDQAFLGIDEELLRRMRTTWDGDIRATAPFLADLVTAAKNVLRNRLDRWPTFTLKEPRLCRLLPFWRPVFDVVGCEVSVIHVIRNPLSVARSLEARNGMSMARGVEIWRDHVVKQFGDTADHWRSVVVMHERMMQDPVLQIARIGDALGLEIDCRRAEAFANDFIQPHLWHHREPLTHLSGPAATLWQKVSEMAI